MNQRISDIINIPPSVPMDLADMAYVIEEYIFEKTGKKLPNGIQLPNQTHPMYGRVPNEVFGAMVVAPETKKINHAFAYALGYFKNK